MLNPQDHPELINHLCRQSKLNASEAEHVLAEVLAYFSETSEEFIRRRHQQLQAQGLSNANIFKTLEAELQAHRFKAKAMSERQIRRMIYG